MGHNVCVLVVCQLRRIISKLLKCAISGNLWIYAWNIPFMGVYQDVLLWPSVFLNKWLHIYCRIQNTKYNDENTRIWLSTRKRLDRHPWRVRFNRQKKSGASANNHTKNRKIAPFRNIWLFVRLVFLIKTTAVHNFHHVCYVILLFKYIYIPTSFQGQFSLWVTMFVCLLSANRGQLLVN